MDDTYDAMVIGSGFGGSISALRLAQAGKSVVVLERGKRYRLSDFPRDLTQTNTARLLPLPLVFIQVMTISAVSERIAEAVINSYARCPS